MKYWALLIVLLLMVIKSKATPISENDDASDTTTECKSESILVENENVNQTCNTAVANYNITAKFDQTPIGTTAYANATCNDTCTDNKNRSIASRKCGANGKWEDPQYRNCAEKTDDVSDALEDYNPDDATTEEVTQTIDVIKEASEQENIPTEDADTILAVTNKVLSTNSDASSSVTYNSETILNSMDELANNIVLEKNTAGYSEYSEEDSNIALAVVALNPDPTAKAITGDTFYYGTDSEWGEGLNLAASDLQLTTTMPGGSYISAVPASENVKISYKFYSDGETLFSKITESLTNGIVYSAAGNVGGNYKFQFELTNDTLTEGDIMCVRWNRTAAGWNEESECKDYSVTDSFGICVCSEDGEYTMRKSDVVDNGGDGESFTTTTHIYGTSTSLQDIQTTISAIATECTVAVIENVNRICNDSAVSEDTTVRFEQTPIGTTAFSNVTCSDVCGDYNEDRSIASRKCGANGKWEEVHYRNCAETDELSNILEDYDPETASKEDVKEAIQVIQNATSKEDITSEEADTILAVTNSLLMSTSSSASDEVTNSSKKILDSMDNLADNVVLEDLGNGYYSYSDMESNVALAVVGNEAMSPKAYEDNTYYYGTDSVWDETLNLAASAVALTTKVPGGSYISAKPASPGLRVSFKFYSDEQGTMLNKIAESVTSGMVLSASGNVKGQYTFNFELIDTQVTDKQIMCVKWKRESKGWNEETTCGSYSVNETFASCVCSEDGEYTMRKAIGEIDDGDDNLSDGAIIGISVGATVAIVLIVVVICCCCNKKKEEEEEEDKKCGLFCCSAICCCFCKKSKVEPEEDTEMKSTKVKE